MAGRYIEKVRNGKKRKRKRKRKGAAGWRHRKVTSVTSCWGVELGGLTGLQLASAQREAAGQEAVQIWSRCKTHIAGSVSCRSTAHVDSKWNQTSPGTSLTHSYTPATLHVVWPGQSKYLHEFVALVLRLLAEGPARHGHLAVHGAHRSVQGTQEHPQVGAAHQVHNGMKRLQERGCSWLLMLEPDISCFKLWQEALVSASSAYGGLKALLQTSTHPNAISQYRWEPAWRGCHQICPVCREKKDYGELW